MRKDSENGFLKEIFNVFFANFPFIRRIFILSSLFLLMVPLLSEEEFSPAGEIIVLSKKISQGNQEELVGNRRAQYIPVSLTDMETENSIIRSVPLIRETVAELYARGLFYQEKSFFQEAILDPLQEKLINEAKAIFALEDNDDRSPIVDELSKLAISNLSISTLPGSNIINISYQSTNPEMGSILVNKLMDNYLEKRQQLIVNETSIDDYQKKKDAYKERINQLEKNKKELYEKNSTTDVQSELKLVQQNISREKNELNKLRERDLEAKQWLTYIKKQLEILKKAPITNFSFPYSFSGDESSNASSYVDTEMKEHVLKVASMQSEYATMSLSLLPGSYDLVQLSKQLAQEKRQLIKFVENRILERTESVSVLEAIISRKDVRINNYIKRANTLSNAAVMEKEMDTEIAAVSDAYFQFNQLYESLRTKKVAQLNEFSNVRILSRASVPLEPSTPSRLVLIILAIVASGVVAITVGLLRETLSGRFRYPEQATEELGVPLIAVFDDFDESGDRADNNLIRR